jgi:hypothetical protein
MAERPDDLGVVRLILARQRRLGTPFERAWELALKALPQIESERYDRAAMSRDQSVAALEQTKPAWQAAYERRPLPQPAREPAYREWSVV